MERRVIVIAGPTCSGKTTLAIEVAKELNTEIISADSRQIYKYLTIGTAKPTKDELKKVPHHLIDILNPDEDYSASKFENDSLGIIEKLHHNGKIPVVAGGTGLYIHAVLQGIFEGVDTDPEYRSYLNKLRDQYGDEYIYEMLVKTDPQSAEKMLPQNWKRVMRALEVYHLTKVPIWKHQEEYVRELDLEFYFYGLEWERDVLYKNIETRVDLMVEQGLLNELKSVLSKGYQPNVNALNTVGYKELIPYLNNEYSLQRAIELIKRNTRRFAKRQFTWFRRYADIQWMKVGCSDDITRIKDEIISKL